MTPLWNKLKFGVLGSWLGRRICRPRHRLDFDKDGQTAIDNNGYHVLNLGVAPLPSNAIKNNMIVELGLIVDAIKRLIQESA